jgi:hypothetical protein
MCVCNGTPTHADLCPDLHRRDADQRMHDPLDVRVTVEIVAPTR